MKKWKVDPSHSTIRFEINHFFVPVPGKFSEFKADIAFDPQNLAESAVTITIPVSSIDTDNEKRDKHLQSGDFFDAKKWPEMTFVSSSFKKTGDDSFSMTGSLSIRDVTKQVEIPFTVLGMEKVKKSMLGKTEILGIKIEWNLDRTEYGVGTGSWAATTVVGDDVSIRAFLELEG